MTPARKADLVALLRPHVKAAIVAQVARWDAERAIEKIFGEDVELETEEAIKDYATAFNRPDEVTDGTADELAAYFVELAKAKGVK